jgi:hypothetical protein
MSEAKPLVYVVVEIPLAEDSNERRVKAVFKSKEAAQEAIDQEFSSRLFDYEIVPRTLYESITG